MRIHEQFKRECAEEVAIQGADGASARASSDWVNLVNPKKYSYHFEWLGRAIIQYPQDIIALQEIIWSVRPDLIVETGIAHGGSLIFSASMLELNASPATLASPECPSRCVRALASVRLGTEPQS